jgi:hypothetical protein
MLFLVSCKMMIGYMLTALFFKLLPALYLLMLSQDCLDESYINVT